MLAELLPVGVGAVAQVVTPDGRVHVDAVGASPGDCFRIASVTKSFVAAAVLRLGIDLDAHIAALVDPAIVELVGDHTVRALLSHTSGLADHAADATYDQDVLVDPDRRWTRLEQVRLCAGLPRFEGHHYSDTAYVILGDLLERAVGGTLPTAVRALLPMDLLPHTWWEVLEPAPSGAPARARQLIGDVEVASLHASLDLWGGGGIVSTCGDLCTFFTWLSHSDLAAAMATEVDAPGNDRHMGLGAFPTPLPGWVGHTGFWNICAGADPATDASVAVAVLQRPPDAPAADEVARTLIGALA
ncbi:MAG TPA: serine hydrolase domain-containing protein [Mycobacteriales bacterium]|nr:serine hydrolase domain-containing protein [Mycobacteriales bacterium]